MKIIISILLIIFCVILYHKILLWLRYFVKPRIKEWLKVWRKENAKQNNEKYKKNDRKNKSCPFLWMQTYFL